MLSQEETVKKTTSVYLNDIYSNEDVSSVLHIQAKLAQFGLDCKDPELLEDGACVLDLDVRQEEGTLQ